WGPEGSVYYDYALNTTVGCTCALGTCMTAAAYGDVDGDGFIATVLYARGTAGAACTDGLFGQLPVVKYNMPATYTDLNPTGAPY
ncbi:MAG TPA: hypothetical protein DEP35_00660, partial [Deltaproteobacteria bacterium]|nr:hypothetical protein [Deltaproteobacteria bacterium]